MAQTQGGIVQEANLIYLILLINTKIWSVYLKEVGLIFNYHYLR